MRCHLADAGASKSFATQFASLLPADFAGMTILLEGELGAGKSTFARAVIQALGHKGAVPSPTYTLIEPYTVAAGSVYHIDLYRISDESELYYLGFEELENGLALVEWPDRARELSARADLSLTFRYAESGRDVQVTAISTRGAHLVATLSANPNT